jgi:mannose-6-phosphate isomerase-like protein (cupin superfamily)
MAQTANPTVGLIPPGVGETLDVLGGPMIVKLDGTGGLFLAEHPVPPGYRVPLHVHDDDEEVFWVLDGTLTLVAAAGERPAGPGTCVRLPRGVPHAFRNDTAATVRFLVICVPGSRVAAMFRALDRAGAAGTLTPEVIGEIAAAHGVRTLAPP